MFSLKKGGPWAYKALSLLIFRSEISRGLVYSCGRNELKSLKRRIDGSGAHPKIRSPLCPGGWSWEDHTSGNTPTVIPFLFLLLPAGVELRLSIISENGEH